MRLVRRSILSRILNDCGVNARFETFENAILKRFGSKQARQSGDTHQRILPNTDNVSPLLLFDVSIDGLFVDVRVVMERMVGIIEFIKNIALTVQIIKLARRGQEDCSDSNSREADNKFLFLDESSGRHPTMTDLRGLENLDEGVSCKHDCDGDGR